LFKSTQTTKAQRLIHRRFSLNIFQKKVWMFSWNDGKASTIQQSFIYRLNRLTELNHNNLY